MEPLTYSQSVRSTGDDLDFELASELAGAVSWDEALNLWVGSVRIEFNYRTSSWYLRT